MMTMNWGKNALLGIGLLASIQSSQAAIIAGTDNLDGTWTVGSVLISLGSVSAAPFGRNDSVRFTTNVTATANLFRRANDLAIGASTNGFSIDYSIFSIHMNGSLAGSTDNWLLLSLENGETDWDTAIQFEFDNTPGIAGDRILSVWHDNASTNENVLQDLSNLGSNVSSFNNIVASPVPEPSSLVLSGLAIFAFSMRRKRA